MLIWSLSVIVISSSYNFPQPDVRLVDRYDSNTKEKGDYNHEMNLAVLPEYFSTRAV